MSLNQSHTAFPTKSAIIYAIVIIMILLGGWQIYQHWGMWLKQSIFWQKQLNQGLSALLQETTEAPLYAGSMLVGGSFLYGLLHALGPGHGKLIITTYIATQATHLKQSVIISLLASLLQGIVAIVLVSTILILFQLSTKHLNQASQYAEQFSYILVMMLGAVLCLAAIRQWWRLKNKPHPSFQTIKYIQSLNENVSCIVSPTHLQTQDQCHCGHKHVIQQSELQQSIKSNILIILSMGIRPCSGALLVLLFSYVIDVYPWGIIAALAMAAGTAMTICGIAIFVHFMRYSAFKFSQSNGIRLHPYWHVGLKLFAGIIFILMGLLMYQSLMMSDMASPLLSPRPR
ncbi:MULTISPECIES: nickel/cobalt transporter [Providencia]|uniref:nickel/cobalt transporter n=1 Tax=Providencia TaxID=586 RepID=UPI000837C1FA|nr:nickel/cobalt transporter [Providencia heimbachae]MBP6120790.1 nickel/cobalt transporter [Providencia sp.]NIH23249.1 nickel/cobalt transporter [Providencia heimbachae]